MACCKIAPHLVLCVAGINKEFTKISNKSYVYNIKDHTAKKCGNLAAIRYTFPAIYFKGFAYVLGGRQFGTDDEATMRYCERMDTNTLQWTKIAPMNENRCSAMAYVYKEKLYVAGGFSYSQYRCESIEVYNDEENYWLMYGLSLPIGLETALTLVKDDSLYFISGRENPGYDSEAIWKADLKINPDVNEFEKVGTVEHKRCLHKGINFGDNM